MKQFHFLIICLLFSCTAVPDTEISTAVATRTVAPTAETTAVSTPTLFPQPSPSATAVPLTQTYQDEIVGFAFQYPAHWTVAPRDHIVSVVHQGTGIALRFRFKQLGEELPLTPSGVSAGDLVNQGEIPFLGQMVAKNVLVYQGKDKAVLYDNLAELPRGHLIFSLQLAANDNDYEAIDIPDAIQTEADAIIASFVIVDTAVPSTPTETATAIPLPQITSQTMSNVEYGVVWSIPVDWVEITEQWPSPDQDTAYWGVWANQPEAAALLTSPPVSVAEGVLVATMQIEPGPETPPAAATTTTVWGQTLYQREMEGDAASPFIWQWEATAVRSPYHYILTFGCIPPSTVMNRQDGNDFCRHYWDSVSFGFGLCVTAAPSAPEATSWQTIADSWYGYSFEIPATWVAAPAVSGDTLILLSHPVHQQPIVGCPIPEGFMKVDFFVNPQLDPDTAAAFTAISPLKDHSAWTRQLEGSEGGNFLAKSREFLIQGTQNRYLLVFYCSPDWSEQCEAIYSHLVESLNIK